MIADQFDSALRYERYLKTPILMDDKSEPER